MNSAISAVTAAVMPVYQPMTLERATGRSPMSLPVCPFMAKRKFSPFQRVESIHTGSSA